MQLAEHFQTNWVPEYAREYIDQLDREYVSSDLLEIAKGQLQQEEFITFVTDSLLFYDTDLITLKIWSDYKYKKTHPWILEQIKKQDCDLYLLCKPDIPWVSDPQRENPTDRDTLFDVYKNILLTDNKPFVEISGEFPQRLEKAIAAVLRLMGKEGG